MESFYALLSLYARNSPVTGAFPPQRPVTRTFGVCFDLRLNKQLSKQSWGWWFETPSRSLWRHCDVNAGVVHKAYSRVWFVYVDRPLTAYICTQTCDSFSRLPHNNTMIWKRYRIIDPLPWNSIGHRWIPITISSNVDLWFCFRLLLLIDWTSCWENNDYWTIVIGDYVIINIVWDKEFVIPKKFMVIRRINAILQDVKHYFLIWFLVPLLRLVVSILSVKRSYALVKQNMVTSCAPPVIVLGMGPTNERQRYNVTSTLIGWDHTKNDPWARIPFPKCTFTIAL